MQAANWVIATATVVIAIQSVMVFVTARKGATETRDLYEAIVIATLISGPSGVGALDQAIEAFKRYFNGKTKLFGGSDRL